MKTEIYLWMICLIAILPIYAQEDPSAPESDKSIVEVVISPNKVTLLPGDKIHFDFIGLDANGERIPAAFTWRFGGGKLNHKGQFTAGDRPGKYTLEAELSTGIKGIAHITILDPNPNSKEPVYLEIVPQQVTLKPGQSCQFKFIAKNAEKKIVSPALSLAFSGGKMDGTGNYTAGNQTGTFSVNITTKKGLKASAKVVILGAEQNNTSSHRVKIIPDRVTLVPGGQCKFQFFVTDSQGKPVQTDLSIALIGGKMNSNGVFTAGRAPGEYKLTITTESGAKGEASITIMDRTGNSTKSTSPQIIQTSPSTPVKLLILPNKVTLNPGEKCQFRFTAVDKNGQNVVPKINIQFIGGKFQGNGTFTAGNRPGKYYIKATTKEGLKASAEIIILGEIVKKNTPGPLAKIILTPERIRLQQGAKCKFSFKAVDKDGRPTPAQLSWSFHGGRLKSDGTYSAGYAPGQYYVILKGGKGISATSVVAILPESPEYAERVWIYLTPNKVKLKPGQSCRFKCRIVDDYGNDVSINNLKWEFLGGKWDEGTKTFTAGDELGDYYVRAVYSKHVKMSAHVEIDY